MKAWGFADIPDQSGRVAVVTGANTGIGLETARMLALKGAEVVMACRNLDKGSGAAERIRAEKPKGTVRVEALDLSDLASVEAFSQGLLTRYQKLDLLIENAGVMVPPLGRTKQGFELQFGTNHLAHFALTSRLMPLLSATPGARVVVVSSGAQSFGHMDFDDLNWEKRGYNAWQAYSQSKLANMLFALELERRLQAAGSGVKVTAAHPGYTATDLQRTSIMGRLFNPIFAMKPQDGALPTLRAAVDPLAIGGSYWGPKGLTGMNGPPVPAKISRQAQVPADAARLWEVSERLTGTSFAIPRSSERQAAG